MRFPVVLHTDDGVRFGETVPDLPAVKVRWALGIFVCQTDRITQ